VAAIIDHGLEWQKMPPFSFAPGKNVDVPETRLSEPS
jgi:hypothetical protein